MCDALKRSSLKLGVLWSGDHVFEGIPETIKLLQSKGIQPARRLRVNLQKVTLAGPQEKEPFS
jgi:hypothetical protein